MIEMRTDNLKYFLTVILVTCSLFISSDTHATQNGLNTGVFSSASANAFAGAGTSANAFAGASASANTGAASNNPNAFTGAFEETGLHSGDGRREIRNYNNRGFPYDNNANRGTKSYGTPPGDVGNLNNRRTGRNKNEGFKCKWENDDCWEKTGTEGDGHECETGEDGDDGQYRPEKYENLSDDDTSEFKKYQPRLELQPPLIHKTRPIITYSDGETQEFDSSSKNDFLTNTRYTGRIGIFGTTPKYEPGWPKYDSFASTLKPPEYGNGVTFGTIPSSQSIWNRRITSNNFSTLTKPTWASGHETSANFGTTLKPTTNWNTGSNVAANAAAKATASAAAGSFSPLRKSEILWNKNDGIPVASFSTTAKPPQEWNIVTYDGDSTGKIPPPHKPGTPWNLGTTSKPGINWNTGFGSNPRPNWSLDYGTTPAVGIPGKQIPVKTDATSVHLGLTKIKPLNSDISVAAPHTESVLAPVGGYEPQFSAQNANTYAGAYAGASGTSGIASNSPGGAIDIAKKDYSFEFDKPYSGINQPYSNTGSALGTTTNYNKFRYGHLPHSTQSLNTLNTFGSTQRLHGGITGTISPISNSIGGQTGSGSNILRDSGTTIIPHTELISNIGTTKSPFSYATTPGFTSSYSTFSGTRSNNLGPSSFNFGSSGSIVNAAASAAANADVNARKSASTITFGTPLGTQNTAGITGTAPGYRESLVYSGIKDSSGSVRPGYGTVSLNTNVGTNVWSKQPENEGKTTSGSGTSGTISDIWSRTSGIRPSEHSETESKILTSAQLNGSNPWLGKQPIYGNNPWLNKVVSESKSRPGITSDIWRGTSGIRPGEQSGSGSKTWPIIQSGVNIRTTSEGYDDTWQNSCNRGLKVPNKTYYPVGTGDGNVPIIANTYQPSSSNIGTESYLGGGNTTPADFTKWNPANPFLFGTKGGNSNTSRHWNSGTTTTVKPIGRGNPFLDRNWSTPKPEYGGGNVNDDRNVNSLGQGNTKPIGQGNFFLENARRRGDIEINRDKGVIPFGERKPKENNPFIVSGSGSSSLDDSATGQLAGSSASAIAGGIGGSFASGNPSSVNNIPDGSPANPGIGIGPVSVPFGTGAGRPGSGENNSAASAANAYSHAESFSQASSFSNSNSFSASGSNNPQNRNWSPLIKGNEHNPAGSNLWAFNGAQATAFANSSAGSWTGNNPIDVKG